MNQKSNISLFTESGCLTIEAMKGLQSSSLDITNKENALKHLEECELCNDAYDGFKLVNDPEKIDDIVTEINYNLQNKLKPSETIPIRPNRHIGIIAYTAAASIIILLGLFFLLNRDKKTDESFAQQAISIVIKESIPDVPVPDTNRKQRSESGNPSIESERKSKPVGFKEEDTEDTFLSDKYESKEFFLEAIVVSTRKTLNQQANTRYISVDKTDTENSQIERVVKIDEEATITEETETIFTVVEELPEFPEGYEKLSKYLRSNLKYPRNARENEIEGKVFVSFIVEENGNISEVNILRGIGGGCDEEAKRVIESMPDWIPGKQRGKAVKVQFNMPIVFKLN